MRVAAIYRYPVKGLDAEPLETVPLAAGDGPPGDRRFAIVRGDTRFAAPKWIPKGKCVMLMRDAELARLRCRVDAAAGTLALGHDGTTCVAAIGSAEDRVRLDAFVNAFLGTRREGPARLVDGGPLSFTDVPANCVSVINLASVRELEARLGATLHPLRFRGNVYVDGGAAWEEFGWIGREIRAGGVVLRVGSRIPRCAATAVNPETAERDLNVVKGLQKTYGHHDMGIYVEVVGPGTLAVGDVVEPRDAAAPSRLTRWRGMARFWGRQVVVALRGRG